MITEKGTLIRWIDNKGFGFIKPDKGGSDLFIHITALKTMSRKPVVGDVIHYRISVDDSGKARAVNAKIEGVAEVLSLAPINRKRKTSNSRIENPYRNSRVRVAKSSRWPSLLTALIIVGIMAFAATKHANVGHLMSQVTTKAGAPAKVTQRFQCQGKVWCSQMSSYEEALFYLQNCPGTKMDGDHDGIPCEQQFGGGW